MDPRTLLPTWPTLALATSLSAVALVGIAARARTTPPAAGGATPRIEPARTEAPALLSETGLFLDVRAGTLAPGVRPFTPQYPLWTDGAKKRRWVYLPAGTTIDARDAEAWVFPAGTRFWKEFSFGARVETRYMERLADGAWIFASYVWRADGSDAERAPENGLRGACATALGTRHDIPAAQDCCACHDASPGRVLGFGALQLAPERDPLAPHAETPAPDALGFAELLETGRLSGSRAELLAAAEPIEARSPRERAALGYLHANCGGCHNAQGPLASLGLELAYRRGPLAPALRTALDRPSHYVPNGADTAVRIAPGAPDASVLAQRMGSRFGPTQMPPLGTHAVDAEALALVRDWIRHDLAAPAVVAARRP